MNLKTRKEFKKIYNHKLYMDKLINHFEYGTLHLSFENKFMKKHKLKIFNESIRQLGIERYKKYKVIGHENVMKAKMSNKTKKFLILIYRFYHKMLDKASHCKIIPYNEMVEILENHFNKPIDEILEEDKPKIRKTFQELQDMEKIKRGK